MHLVTFNDFKLEHPTIFECLHPEVIQDIIIYIKLFIFIASLPRLPCERVLPEVSAEYRDSPVGRAPPARAKEVQPIQDRGIHNFTHDQ